MGASLSTFAHSRKPLPPFPNKVSKSVTAETSARGVSNPAFDTGIQIDLLLASHANFLRSAMRNKLFGKSNKRCEQSLKDYISALRLLNEALLSSFEKLCEEDPQMAEGDWENVDMELVVINDDMKVAFTKAEQDIKSRKEEADIDASATEVKRIIGKAERLVKPEDADIDASTTGVQPVSGKAERLAKPKGKGVGRKHRRT